MRARRVLQAALFICSLVPAAGAVGGDWPMWRRDARRSARSPDALPAELHLRWVHRYPPLEPAFRNRRLRFDAGYEPVVLGDTVFVGSSRNDRVTALDADTGYERWRFYAEGPVRFAPVAGDGKVWFGSDDGHLYCLDADRGTLLWRFRAVPERRLVIGNGRLISVWPVRGGPVLADGVVYFAAGVWSFEGVFVYALDAASGDVVWRNDSAGFIYGDHPHNAEAFGGLTPQGYLAVDGDALIVPCGPAFPASFDRRTGELRSFALPRKSRLPGGWFAIPSKAERHGEVVFDSDVHRDRHEDRVYRAPGTVPGLRSTVTVGDRTFSYDEGFEGVEGSVHSILAADDKLFVVARDGTIRCFGPDPGTPRAHPSETVAAAGTPSPVARKVIEATGARHGRALVRGLDDARLPEDLARLSELRVVAVDPDAGKVAALRRRLDAAGLLGTRVSVLRGAPGGFDFPPYFANLIVLGDADMRSGTPRPEVLRAVFRSLRPYGGLACVRSDPSRESAIRRRVGEAGLERCAVRSLDGLVLIERVGALPGATDYLGGWKSPDELVRAPLGVLWYDDTLGHFKRSPQPKFSGGLMISHPKDWTSGKKNPYPLLPAAVSDVYTGRVLARGEVARVAPELLARDERPQPVQYRPHYHEGSPWKPRLPDAGERTNPLTGRREKRVYPRSYGCDGGIDYGYIVTMRSGTAAFYDKTVESGTINISGPRSGCTNSVIPACGVLNVPYFYEGCTCSYPLPAGLALVSMPEVHEQWTSWGEGRAGPVRRVGLNLGAPGDRVTRDGTLWLEFPSRGGPSPDLAVTTAPGSVEFYYDHALWIAGGRGWPWVAASGATGLESLTLGGLEEGSYLVRLFFCAPDERAAGAFDVSLQGETLLEEFDPRRAAGGAGRSVSREFPDVALDGSLRLELRARGGATQLSGIEVIREGLPAGEIPVLEERDTSQLFR